MLDVHVIGAASEATGDELLVLCDKAGAPELIVCAIPYLRDRDIRTAAAGESVGDKERKLREGIRRHYEDVAALAQAKRNELDPRIPVVGMGHLFTEGGLTVDGDGVRELYIGSLARVAAGNLPGGFDYLALGHLHVPQPVNGSHVIRYSGSPLPMGFGESGQQKSVSLVDFSGRQAHVRTLDVPVFQKMESIRGNWAALSARIMELSVIGSSIWLEVIYDGEEIMADLRVRLDEMVAGTGMEILRVKNNRIIDRAMEQIRDGEALDDLNRDEVFNRCLESRKVPEEQRPELLRAYLEIALSIDETGTEG